MLIILPFPFPNPLPLSLSLAHSFSIPFISHSHSWPYGGASMRNSVFAFAPLLYTVFRHQFAIHPTNSLVSFAWLINTLLISECMRVCECVYGACVPFYKGACETVYGYTVFQPVSLRVCVCAVAFLPFVVVLRIFSHFKYVEKCFGSEEYPQMSAAILG